SRVARAPLAASSRAGRGCRRLLAGPPGARRTALPPGRFDVLAHCPGCTIGVAAHDGVIDPLVPLVGCADVLDGEAARVAEGLQRLALDAVDDRLAETVAGRAHDDVV